MAASERRILEERARLLALRELVRWAGVEDPEIERLGHVGSPWDLVTSFLEMRGAPKSVTQAERLLGRGVPLSKAESKPRDSEMTAVAIKDLRRAGPGTRPARRSRAS